MKRTTRCSRALSKTAIASALALTLGAAGCDCGGDDPKATGGTPGATSSGPGSGGGGGEGGSGGGSGGVGAGNGALSEAKKVVEFSTPLDATLSNDGAIVYFTAFGPNGAGVFSVPAAGGTPLELAVGDPFVAPFGLALSTDGKTLYVADLGVQGSDMLDTDGGKIFSVSSEGGAPTEVTTTDDTVPRGLDVIEKDGSDVIYYTGRDGTGAPALLEVPAQGGRPTVVASGAPLSNPGGVAATADVVYVLDTTASSQGLASILEIKGGAATELVAHLPVGWPAGIALSLDGTALLVSGYDAATGNSAALRVDLVSEEITAFPDDDTFAGFDEPGGLHRGRNVDSYAFVEGTANGGMVYVLE